MNEKVKRKKGKENEKTNKQTKKNSNNRQSTVNLLNSGKKEKKHFSYTLSLDMNKSTCQIPAKGQPILRKGDRFGLKNVTVYVGAPNFPILRKTSDLNQ